MPRLTRGARYADAALMGRVQSTLLALGMAATAYVVARLSLGSVVQAEGIAALWPLSGLTVGLLARADRRAWPWILGAIALGAFAANLHAGRPAGVAAGFAAANALEGLIGGGLLQRFAGRAPRLRDLRQVAVLLLTGPLAGAGAAAVVASLVASRGLGAAPLEVLRVWWIGDAVGILTVTPLLLTLPQLRRPQIQYIAPSALLGGLTLLAVATAAAWIFFTGAGGGTAIGTLSYATFPPLLLCAWRLGPAGSAAAFALLAGLATTATLQGSGPFAEPGAAPLQQMLELQLFLLTAATMTLCVAAMVAERSRARASLEHNENELWQNERRMREAQSNANVGSWDWDLTSRVLQWSDEQCRIHGLRPTERPADLEGWLALVHPGDREELEGATLEAGDPNAEFELEHRIVRPDGAVRWVHTRGRSGSSRRGSARRLFGTSQDITRRRLAEDERRASEERFRTLLENLPDTTVLLLDTDLRVVSVDGDLERIGWRREEVEGKIVSEILAPERRGDYVAAARAALAGEPGELEWRSTRAEREFWLRFRPVRDSDGVVVSVLVAASDVTELHRAQAGMREAEQRFRTAFESAPIGMALIDADGHFSQVNPALRDLVGYSARQLEAMTLAAITHPEHADRDDAGRRDLLAGRTRQWRTETRAIHATGQAVWVELNATRLRGEEGAGSLLLSLQDISERRRFEGRMQHMADHDPLTGLFNRRKFELELSRHVQEASRYERAGALLSLDLDDFKAVNAAIGNGGGDELIVMVAGILRRRLRETDVVARLGGDSFAVILPRATSEEAEIVAQALVEEIRAGAVVRERHVTASVGIAVLDRGVASSEDALTHADLAMHAAKQDGRDRVAHFDAERSDRPRTGRRTAWSKRIRAALEQDGFELHAQPLLDLATGDVSRYELLVRMLGEDGELIAPATFLSAAERFDLVQDIDRWVTGRAIDLLGVHHAAGRPLALEVNVSAKSLDDDRLLRLVEERLAGADIDPGSLVFEVSETAAVANLQAARDFAERLRVLGCRFALDDFGAGFGSFYYLKHLPFDYLKIDGEFVAHCLDNRTDQLVIESVVSLARGLGKQTIAEFTSSAEHVAFLRDSGVDFAQGFHVGAPRPVAEVLALAPGTAAPQRSGLPAPSRGGALTGRIDPRCATKPSPPSTARSRRN